MSTLAAARADNFYYPPEWDPKKGGLNKQQGQHPLRDRARKLDQGILIIRFEMPFNVWCEGCNHLIGKGVRFNAEKKQIGNYFSSKTWSFVMRSPCCQTRIEIQTDPENAEYVVVSGARQKVEAFSAADAETLELPDEADKAKYDDPLCKLERGQEDKRKAIDNASRIQTLYSDSLAKSKDDYAINKALRRTMREARKAEKARDERRQELGLPESVRLLPETAADADHAALISFGDPTAHEKARRLHRQAIKTQSIFATPPAQVSRLALQPPQPHSAPARQTSREAGGNAHPSAPALPSGQSASDGSGLLRPTQRAGGAHTLLDREPHWHAGPGPGTKGHRSGAVEEPARAVGSREMSGAERVSCFGGALAAVRQKGLAALGIKTGAVKKRTVADKAAQALKQRRMASGLTLGFTAPEAVPRPGPTFVMKR